MLQPHWGKLATKMKGAVKVAYWDTETGIRPPAALGEIRGTPTMKVFVPRKKSRKNKKMSMDYNGPRELKDMKAFAEHHMPNFVEAINGDSAHAKFLEKAEKHGLPVALLFSKSKATKPMIKAMSSIFRRRLLLGEIRGSANNKALIQKYGVTKMPHLMVLGKDDAEPVVFNKKPTFNRLKNFLEDHALKVAIGKKQKEQKKKRGDAESSGSGGGRKHKGGREEL